MHEVAERLALRFFDPKLIDNSYRGAVVEALVEPFLKPGGWRWAAGDWNGWDFDRPSDGARIEVKQSAARQPFHKPGDAPYAGSFSIAPSKSGRLANVYVFGWHGVGDPDADHRDVSQWEFYVVPAKALRPEQKGIALSSVQNLAAPVKASGLLAAVERAIAS